MQRRSEYRGSHWSWRWFGAALLFASTALIAGCTGDSPESRIAAANNSNVQRLSNLYKAYQLRHGNKGPEDEEAFKKFFREEMTPKRLEAMGVDPANVDSLFVSDEDGQPLVIRWGVPGGLGTSEPAVFDQGGDGGQPRVGFTGGSVERVDKARYEQLLQGGK